MSLQIVEIKNTRQGEVAYLFDGQRVFKVFVEDYTGARPEVLPEAPRRQEYYEDEAEYAPEPIRRIRVRGPQPPLPPSEEDVVGPPPRHIPKATRANIVPPGIAAVFKPQGSPGEATETRRV